MKTIENSKDLQKQTFRQARHYLLQSVNLKIRLKIKLALKKIKSKFWQKSKQITKNMKNPTKSWFSF